MHYQKLWAKKNQNDMKNENFENKYSSEKSFEGVERTKTLNNFEQETKAEIHSYFENISPEDLTGRVWDGLNRITDPIRKKIKLKGLHLGENASETEVKSALYEHILKYQERVNELNNFIPEHLKKVHEWLDEKDLTPKQNPDLIPVIISDEILHLGVENDYPPVFGEYFDVEHNTIFLTGQENLNAVAHEYFHGMAYNSETKEAGFKHFLEGKHSGNVWLDEGITMIGEFATFPTREKNKRDKYDEMYDGGYYWLTQLFLKELNVSQDEALRAYFMEEPYRSQFEKKTKERFGCTIDELNELLIGYSDESKEKIIKIIKGESVKLEAMEGSGLDKSYIKLQHIFPKIEVIITPRPVFD